MTTGRSKRALFVVSLLTALFVTGTVQTPAAPIATTLTVPIAGTVMGLPESVSLSGSVQIVSTLVLDPLLGSPPRVRLSITLINVSGVGLSSGLRYVATGETTLLRLLKMSDRIEITLPFYRDTPAGRSSARSTLVAITLTSNLVSGLLTAATANFSTPNFAM